MLRFSRDHVSRHEGVPFDVDCWYPLCSEITFPTVFLPISRATAYSVCRYFATRFFQRDFPVDSGLFFSREDVDVLEAWEHQIDTLLKENAHLFPHGAFVRMAGHSTKDADPALSVIAQSKEIFASEVHNLSQMYGYPEDDPKTQFMATGRVPWMRVTNASEAMSLLLSSEYVFVFFRDWLLHGHPEILCFRAWCPELRMDREFRLFVCNGRLTAITQYDHLTLYPHLLLARKALFNNIVGFWKEQVHPRFKNIPNYSVDLGIMCEPKDLSQEYKRENCILLEFSPFLRSTGEGVFSWDSPADLAILCGDAHKDDDGDFPPEMRLREVSLEGVEDMLEVGWTNRWSNAEDYRRMYNEAVQRKGWIGRLWDKTFGHKTVETSLVFACDGLQRGHFWHRKYLETCSSFHGCATAEGFHISVDPVSGSPELARNEAGKEGGCKSVKGEVFAVENESIADLDMFYDSIKGRHTKETITVVASGRPLSVLAYILVDEPQGSTEIEEFTLDMEKNNYNPILHMAAVSESYLQAPILTFKR